MFATVVAQGKVLDVYTLGSRGEANALGVVLRDRAEIKDGVLGVYNFQSLTGLDDMDHACYDAARIEIEKQFPDYKYHFIHCGYAAMEVFLNPGEEVSGEVGDIPSVEYHI